MIGETYLFGTGDHGLSVKAHSLQFGEFVFTFCVLLRAEE